MADVFDFELHETNTGSLDEDSDDVILDDVSTLKAKKILFSLSLHLCRLRSVNLIDKNIILLSEKT